MLDTNLDADVEFLKTIEGKSIRYCSKECNKYEGETEQKCDLFVYIHSKEQCDLLNFKRRSFVLQIGITSDSIFCMKPSKISNFVCCKFCKNEV